MIERFVLASFFILVVGLSLFFSIKGMNKLIAEDYRYQPQEAELGLYSQGKWVPTQRILKKECLRKTMTEMSEDKYDLD